MRIYTHIYMYILIHTHPSAFLIEHDSDCYPEDQVAKELFYSNRVRANYKICGAKYTIKISTSYS